MFNIGMSEMVVVLIVALLVFGPQRLPEIAKILGKSFTEFRRAGREVIEAAEKMQDMADETKHTAKEAITIDAEIMAEEKERIAGSAQKEGSHDEKYGK